MKYSWRSDGEWFPVPTTKRMAMACCDCGLVHRTVARVTKTGRVYFAAVRDEDETTRLRRVYGKRFRGYEADRRIAARAVGKR